MENIVISNPAKLEKTKKSIARGGAEKLHLVSDFDRTLTNAFVGGKSVPSIISVLRDGNYLTPDYAQKAQELYDKYHPIEINFEIPLEERKKLMEEWWSTHFELLIKSGLNKKDLERIVESQRVKFRDGFEEFADFLKLHDIPLVIISSSGLGGEIISMYFKKEDKLHDNVHIISNSFEWDKKGKVLGVKKPIIHILNKDEAILRNSPVFESVKNRKNVLLLGDTLDDIGMVAGFDYENLITVGFLNENVEENLERYRQNFDITILNDPSITYVSELLKEMIK